MRLLVVTADGTESVLPAITHALDYLGTPYTIYTATASPGGLTSARLSRGCLGLYYGVILTTSELGYWDTKRTWTAALTDAEWLALRAYEQAFKVRRVTWYTFPAPAYGFQYGYPVDTTARPVAASLTLAGTKVFGYLNPATPLMIQNAYAYLAAPLDANTTPLLQDAEGHALAATYVNGDGRENLALTFDGNQYLLHSTALAYGAVNWVTRGSFLGDRRAY